MLGLLWQIFVFIIMTIFEKVAYMVDEILFTLENYGVYEKVVKVRKFFEKKERKIIYP